MIKITLSKKTLAVFIIMAAVMLLISFSGCAAMKSKASAGKTKDIVREITGMVAQKAKTGSIKRIAIIEFTAISGDESGEGKLITERLITSIVNEGFVSVIERNKIDKLLEEQKLQFSGIIDASTAKEVGMMLGVDAMVIGTIAKTGDTNEVNARLIDVKTGEILGATTEQEAGAAIGEVQLEVAQKAEFENNEWARVKKVSPRLYKEKIEQNKRLIDLKEKQPLLLEQLINTKRRLFQLASENQQKFLKMLGAAPVIPIGYNMMDAREAVKLMRVYFPKDYERIIKLKQDILGQIEKESILKQNRMEKGNNNKNRRYSRN
jgi:TolB-like protein